MEPSPQRFSRPVYEGLPWLYVFCGVAALVVSYLLRYPVLSFVLGVAGFLALLGGIVILLRRRDYRKLRAQYGDPDSLEVRSTAPVKEKD